MADWLKNVLSDPNILSAVRVTFTMAVCSTAIASVLGITFGILLERFRFPGKKIVIRINRTLMGSPPVVVGLIVYLLLMRRGPLGPLSLLFTIQGMVIAQTLIITPIICGMIYSYLRRSAPSIREFAVTMGADRWQTIRLIIRELRKEIYFCMVTGFGRSISEVGAVMLVGGNIRGRTRTMTTTISLLKSQGIFTEGVALGILLLLMAFVLQWICDMLHREEQEDENY